MRGSSSGGMPTPVSATVEHRLVAVPAARRSRRGRRAGVYLTALSSRLASTCRIRLRSTATTQRRRRVARLELRRPAPRRRPRRGRRVCRTSSASVDRLARSRIVPVSASEMSISVFSIADDAVGLLEAVGQRLAQRRADRRTRRPSSAMPRRRVIGVRRSCATLSSAPRMPGDQRLDAVEHRVHQRAELVERVAGVVGGHARARCVPSAGCRARCRPASRTRLQRRAREDRAAGQADDSTIEQRRSSSRTRRKRAQQLVRAAPCSCRPGTACRRASRTDTTSSTSPSSPVRSVAHVCSPLERGGSQLRQVEAPPVLRHAEEHDAPRRAPTRARTAARAAAVACVAGSRARAADAAARVGGRVLRRASCWMISRSYCRSEAESRT